MNCRQIHRHLLAWIEGDLDEATWLLVAQHLESCGKCLSEVKRLQQLIETMRAIAGDDSVPPIPQRLWRKLLPRHKRLPSFAVVFVTACLAFLIGWHARGIAFSNQPLQVNAFETTTVSANTKRRQSIKTQRHLALPSNLTKPLAKIPNYESRQRSEQIFLGRPSSAPTSFYRQQPLMLNGATALAWGEKVLSNHLDIDLGTGVDLEKDFASGELQLTENDVEPVTEFVWGFIPVEIPQPIEQQPYRIFVQVTDLETQTVRTIKVDTTQPHHIVAEWSEVNGSEIGR